MLIEHYCVHVIASMVILQYGFSPSNNVAVICYIDSPYDICYYILRLKYVIIKLQTIKITCMYVCMWSGGCTYVRDGCTYIAPHHTTARHTVIILICYPSFLGTFLQSEQWLLVLSCLSVHLDSCH